MYLSTHLLYLDVLFYPSRCIQGRKVRRQSSLTSKLLSKSTIRYDKLPTVMSVSGIWFTVFRDESTSKIKSPITLVKPLLGRLGIYIIMFVQTRHVY